jgi:hypothetical protein
MKRQKWLRGVLVVMLVASLLLAVGTFAPIVAAGGGGGIEPEETCSYFMCATDYNPVRVAGTPGILGILLLPTLSPDVSVLRPVLLVAMPLVVGARVEDSPQLNLPESPFCPWAERALCLRSVA